MKKNLQKKLKSEVSPKGFTLQINPKPARFQILQKPAIDAGTDCLKIIGAKEITDRSGAVSKIYFFLNKEIYNLNGEKSAVEINDNGTRNSRYYQSILLSVNLADAQTRDKIVFDLLNLGECQDLKEVIGSSLTVEIGESQNPEYPRYIKRVIWEN